MNNKEKEREDIDAKTEKRESFQLTQPKFNVVPIVLFYAESLEMTEEILNGKKKQQIKTENIKRSK